MAANRIASKSAAAFRTISEVSDELEVPQHVLRFWETKFTQVRPMKRGGGRRYYRPEDIELLRRIRDLLYSDGYTIKGVQKLLREGQVKPPAHEDAVAEQERAGAPPPVGGSALDADTTPEAAARAQPSEPFVGQPEEDQPAGDQPAGDQPAGYRPAGEPSGQATARRHPQSGRTEGPAARATTATPAQRPPEAGLAAAQTGPPEPTAAAHAEGDNGLSPDKREAIRSILDELRAARAELKRRTGQ